MIQTSTSREIKHLGTLDVTGLRWPDVIRTGACLFLLLKPLLALAGSIRRDDRGSIDDVVAQHRANRTRHTCPRSTMGRTSPFAAPLTMTAAYRMLRFLLADQLMGQAGGLMEATSF